MLIYILCLIIITINTVVHKKRWNVYGTESWERVEMTTYFRFAGNTGHAVQIAVHVHEPEYLSYETPFIQWQIKQRNSCL